MDFSFPFPPYDIQNEFMIALFDTLDKGKLGIFESPTGTGKSLSIICGTLTWMNHHLTWSKQNLENIAKEEIGEVTGENWFSATAEKIEKENEKRKSKLILDKIEQHELKFRKLRTRSKEIKTKYSKLSETKGKVDEENLIKNVQDEIESDEKEFLLDDYLSDNDDDDDDYNKQHDDIDDDNPMNLKIYYCSRTHSQLSQFVREIQKTRFAESVRVCFLGSRQTLCINDEVKKLPTLSLINERCMELQKGYKTTDRGGKEDSQVKKKSRTSTCPFKKQTNIEFLSNEIHLEVQDLEQLVSSSRLSMSCPYYASRRSVHDSQLVIMPYNCLLHKATREACNVKLKNNVVIVDEAHNLLETIANIYSVILSLEQISNSIKDLSEYLVKFQRRLSPKNLLYVKQIVFLLKSFQRILWSGAKPFEENRNDSQEDPAKVFSVTDFIFETSTDNLEFRKIIAYLNKSKIAYKIRSYRKKREGEMKTVSSQTPISSTKTFLSRLANKTDDENCKKDQVDEKQSHLDGVGGLPGLLSLASFLECLSCGFSDGRVVVSRPGFSSATSKGYIKFILLNPAAHFHDIVRECRSVVVAGGTMSPRSEFRNGLFVEAGASRDRIREFFCGHVVASDNVLPLVLKTGPANRNFDFTFKNRKETCIMDELGRCLVNVCNVIPGGVVVFLPSYEYENHLLKYFETTRVLQRLNDKKTVFREPRSSAQMERILRSYSECAVRNGAILFSVVGGKMSEGINFSDDLGRGVVMVGLPFPNSFSVELKTKMQYLNRHSKRETAAKSPGDLYYEGLCFKAVNQSIGRAIRHRQDYACILFLDHRYAQPNSRSNLPTWINSELKVREHFGQAFTEIKKFFNRKKI